MGLAAQAVEGAGRRAVGQVHDAAVQRAVLGQALQRAGDGALVAGVAGVGELDRAGAAVVGGHFLGLDDQVHAVVVIGQRGVEEGQVAGDLAEAALHAAVGGQDGVGGGRGVAAVGAHVHHGAGQRGLAAHLDAAVLAVGRGGDAVGRILPEAQVAPQLHRAHGPGGIARREHPAGQHHVVEGAGAGQDGSDAGLHRAAELAFHLQGAIGIDGEGAGIGAAVAEQGQGAVAENLGGARAGQRAGVGPVVRPPEEQLAIVDDVAGQRAGVAAVADLQRAAVDAGDAGQGIVAGQDQGA